VGGWWAVWKRAAMTTLRPERGGRGGADGVIYTCIFGLLFSFN
jgi:hypothetical protein